MPEWAKAPNAVPAALAPWITGHAGAEMRPRERTILPNVDDPRTVTLPAAIAPPTEDPVAPSAATDHDKKRWNSNGDAPR